MKRIVYGHELSFATLLFRYFHYMRWVSPTYVSHGGSKGKENTYVERKGEKVACMGVEPTPSAIQADVLSQLD